MEFYTESAGDAGCRFDAGFEMGAGFQNNSSLGFYVEHCDDLCGKLLYICLLSG